MKRARSEAVLLAIDTGDAGLHAASGRYAG